MIGRIVLAALLAGMLAGLLTGGVLHFRITPLVLAAETYEKPEGAAPEKCIENMPGMKMCAGDVPAWQPAEGFERTAYTTLAAVLAGAGFAMVMAGVALVSGLPLNAQNGLIWGLCGFISFSLAPAAGLAPEPPAMPVADLLSRQLWWAAAALSTAMGLWLIAAKPHRFFPFFAIAALALPHLIGAPIAMPHETQVPPTLASEFAANSLAVNAVFWALIGLFLGLAFDNLERKKLLHG